VYQQGDQEVREMSSQVPQADASSLQCLHIANKQTNSKKHKNKTKIKKADKQTKKKD